MRNRVMGEEIEWTGGCRLGTEGQWLSIGAFFEKISELILFKYPSAKGNLLFLPNGARVYNEQSTGQHLETALPECSTAREVLKFDKWSERFVCWVARELKEKYDSNARFFKKNYDSGLETRGCHENYFSEKIFKKLVSESEQRLKEESKTLIHPEINYFILFLITRQIFTGCGGIMLYSKKSEDDIYEISPRTYFISAVLSASTTSSGKQGRAIINTKDEPLSDNNKYWRNHLILGDANMADLSIFLKFGTTSAIIEMIEKGSWNDDLLLDNPADAPSILKSISKDLTLQNVLIRLKNGRAYTALQIQKKFCKNWRRHIRDTGQGDEKAEVAERWREVLGRLEIDDERLYSQLDWKIKMRLLRLFMDKKGLPLNHESVLNIDALYHNPDQEKGLYYKLKNRSGSNFISLVSESEIAKADNTPPNTRAKLRTTIKKILNELNLTCTFDWNSIGFRPNPEGDEYKILMSDPRLSFLSSLNLEVNAEAIKYLNSIKPSAIIA